ncbi:hypothetical protein CDD83_206 [Cordyceps sp. RAO-2017]|nr:hypothetical protein CDD83_206 [Cordyceps sp. RAO-2017]
MASRTPIVGVPDRVVPMRVIVCGLHRTGTMSMRSALWQLGIHDCYHMHTVIRNLDSDPQQWVRAFEAKYAGKGSFDKADWDRLLGHSQACCDMPAAVFSAELAALYPDAKVVILNRDPDKWYESVLHSIYKTIRPSSWAVMASRWYAFALDPQMRNWARLNQVMSKSMGFDHGKEKERALAWFREQYDGFRDRIPAERRLEYSIKDGWKPLCDFLDLPVPTVEDAKTGKRVEAPFPHINDRETFAINSASILTDSKARAHENLFALLGRAAVVGVVAYGTYLGWTSDLGRRLF